MLRSSITQSLQKYSTLPKCKRLEGKVAVVTASTDGIGFSIARRLAQEGANVMISSRKESNVIEAVKSLREEGLNVCGVTCHVGKSEDRNNLLTQTKCQFGKLDILVSNAATNPAFGPLFECTEEIWDKIFEVNVKSTFLLIKESLPLLKLSTTPSIIIISSIAGYQPINFLGPYSISKTALLALCKTAADELAQDGIRVNGIAPGIIKTKFSKALYESESAHEAILERIALKRLGTPEEIGNIATFLASDDASYITGEIIVASGGMQSRL